MTEGQSCGACGAPLDADARFCQACGAPVQEAVSLFDADSADSGAVVPGQVPVATGASSGSNAAGPILPSQVPIAGGGEGSVGPPPKSETPSKNRLTPVLLGLGAGLIVIIAVLVVVLVRSRATTTETGPMAASPSVTAAPATTSAPSSATEPPITSGTTPRRVAAALAGITDGRKLFVGDPMTVTVAADPASSVRRVRLLVDGVERDAGQGSAASLTWQVQGEGPHEVWAELELDDGTKVSTARVQVVVVPKPTAPPDGTPTQVVAALTAVYQDFVRNDWPALRSQFLDLKGKVPTMSDAELAANYGLVREYELVPASVTPNGSGVWNVRLGVITHEQDGGRRYSRVMCIPMRVTTDPDFFVEQTGAASRFDTYEGWVDYADHRGSLASC